jgi:hypothetical protein
VERVSNEAVPILVGFLPMTSNSFEGLSFSEKQLIYRGLLCLVTSNSGYGFHNHDQGHPAYAVGQSGEFSYQQWGDAPDRNHLFQMMHSLSVELSAAEIDSSAEISDYVFSWADFCRLAYSAYEKAKKKT